MKRIKKKVMGILLCINGAQSAWDNQLRFSGYSLNDDSYSIRRLEKQQELISSCITLLTSLFVNQNEQQSRKMMALKTDILNLEGEIKKVSEHIISIDSELRQFFREYENDQACIRLSFERLKTKGEYDLLLNDSESSLSKGSSSTESEFGFFVEDYE